MGSYEKTFELSESMATSLPDNVCIVASAGEIAALRETIGVRDLPSFELIPLDSMVPLPADIIARASLLVVEVDQNDPASLRRVNQVRTLRPSLPIVVALRDANLAAVRTLIRQGVDDVCSLPIDFDELYDQLCDAAAKLRDKPAAQPALSPLVAVVRSNGGSGATSVATHLAAALARQDERKRGACLIDLDIQFGNVATSLGCEATQSITDVLSAGDRLDSEILSSAAIATGRGFDVIAAPEEITPLETVDVDQLLRILSLTRRNYGAVIVDLPANWTNWTLSTILASTDIVLITDLSIAGLRQAKRRLELFSSVGLAAEKIHVVINRVEKRVFRTIGVDEVRKTLGHPVFATLALEGQLLAASQDQGLLSWEANRKSKFAANIASLAAKLVDHWGGR